MKFDQAPTVEEEVKTPETAEEKKPTAIEDRANEGVDALQQNIEKQVQKKEADKKRENFLTGFIRKTLMGMKTWEEQTDEEVKKQKIEDGVAMMKNPEKRFGAAYKLYMSLPEGTKRDKLAYAVGTKDTGSLTWSEADQDWTEVSNAKVRSVMG